MTSVHALLLVVHPDMSVESQCKASAKAYVQRTIELSSMSTCIDVNTRQAACCALVHLSPFQLHLASPQLVQLTSTGCYALLHTVARLLCPPQCCVRVEQ